MKRFLIPSLLAIFALLPVACVAASAHQEVDPSSSTRQLVDGAARELEPGTGGVGSSYFLVVRKGAVVGGQFAELEDAKTQLAKFDSGSRLVAEVKDGEVMSDPTTIAGHEQTEANGFRSYWHDSADINSMIDVAKTYVAQRQPKGNSNGNGPPDWVLEKVPAQALERFIKNSQILPGVDTQYQEVTDENTVDIDGITISINEEDLTPRDILAKGSRISVDGVEKVSPPLVFESKIDKSITVTKGNDGKLMSASRRTEGRNSDVLPVGGGVFATVDEADLDNDQLKQFSLGPAQQAGRRQLRSITSKAKGAGKSAERHIRSLQTVDFSVLEVDIVIDSYFCAEYGGATDAEARARTIVDEASKRYEVFAVKLKIKTLQIYCEASSDPIRAIFDALPVGSSTAVCGSGTDQDLLKQFKLWVPGQSDLTGDVIHLFHGFDFTGTSTIGCAYIQVLCDPWDWNVGVDEITFSTTLFSQAKLVAHELGHNFGANHYTSETAIMNPYECSTCNDFNQVSIDIIKAEIADAPSGCIHLESDVPRDTTAEIACEDFGDPFVYLGDDLVGCAYFAQNYPEWYCTYQVVADYCPVTCNSGCAAT